MNCNDLHKGAKGTKVLKVQRFFLAHLAALRELLPGLRKF
jgi:hypothetical protein